MCVLMARFTNWMIPLSLTANVSIRSTSSSTGWWFVPTALSAWPNHLKQPSRWPRILLWFRWSALKALARRNICSRRAMPARTAAIAWTNSNREYFLLTIPLAPALIAMASGRSSFLIRTGWFTMPVSVSRLAPSQAGIDVTRSTSTC